MFQSLIAVLLYDPTQLFKYVFIYLAAPGLSFDTQDLRSSVQHLGSLVEVCGLYLADQGLSPGPLPLGAWHLSHWITRKAPDLPHLIKLNTLYTLNG